MQHMRMSRFAVTVIALPSWISVPYLVILITDNSNLLGCMGLAGNSVVGVGVQCLPIHKFV